MMLELTNIHAGYNGMEILTGTTLKINSGEIVALIGPNGAGKSTVLKVISGFIYPKLGKIIFDGLNITGLETNKRVSMGIGYFLQGGEVFPDMSVYENLEMGGASLKKNVFKARLDETIKLFPLLTDKLNKRAGLLSGGERQMLALSMIMLNRPKLLLLDEPSAGLAPGLVKGIMEKIVEINKTYGIAILLVEQKVGEALSIADRGYLLKNGQVVFEGSPDEIKETISGGLSMFKFDRLKDIFKDYPYIASAYLFGSQVTGKTGPMSDIDIAILLKDNAPKGRELIHKIDYLAYRIEDALQVKEVDLIELNKQGLIFVHNVLKTGKLIYDADSDFRIKFVVKIISNYCDFEPTLRFMNNYYFEGYKRRLAAL